MKIATTTYDFQNYCGTYIERIKKVYDAGFRYIDLNFSYSEKDELLASNNWRENVEKIREYAEKLGVTFVQAHSPCNGDPAVRDSRYASLISATIRSIEICGMLGISNIVVHSGPRPERQDFFVRNREFYRELFPAAERCNVNILCENSTKANMGDNFFTNSGEEMLEFIKYVNHPLFHACWDTGHAHIEGEQYKHIMTLGEELYGIHVHDNRGTSDEHLLPYLGTINMDELMSALIDSGYKGFFTMEACSSARPAKYWLGDRRTFERNDRIISPPLFFQQQMEALMYNVARYVTESYGVFEE